MSERNRFNKMKIICKVEKTINIVELRVDAEVRYWEYAKINGIDDTEDGENVPCKFGDSWMPVINVDTGAITNWKQGICADIHYKVCDAGIYSLFDEECNMVFQKSGYVPKCMCPSGMGYGDYIIMQISETGIIKNWKPDFSDIINQED